MKLRTILPDCSPGYVRDDGFWTHCVLAVVPHFPNEAAQYKAFVAHADAVASEERTLTDGVIAADAAYNYADEVCDPLVDRVEQTLLLVCDKNRSHPLYRLFFDKYTPAQLKRPTLGPELEVLRAWVDRLTNSEHASLQSLAPLVQNAVKQADQAERNLITARNAMRDFRVTGNGRKLVDEYNALRADVHGKITSFAHSHLDLNLGSDYASSFFRQVHRAPKPTLKQLDEDIARTQNELLLLNDQRAALVGEQQAAEKARADSDKKMARADLTAAQAQLAQLQKQIEQLRVMAEG